MNTTKQEKSIKELFLKKCWGYLDDNFHKFNEANKIKIALTLVAKDIPQEVTGMNLNNIVMMNDIIKDGKKMRYNLGQPVAPSGDIEDTGQVRSDTNES